MKELRKVRWNVLAAIEYVCSKTKDKKLKFENTPKMHKCLEHLKAFFGGINETQVIILCGLLDINFSKVRDMTVSKYFNISSLNYLQHNKEIEDLSKRNLVTVSITNTGHSYSFNDDVIRSILRNQKITIIEKKYDSVSFTKVIRDIIDTSWKEHDAKMREAYDFEQKHLDIPFVKDINACVKSYEDRYCLYTLCYYYTHGWVAELQTLFLGVYDSVLGPRNMELMITGKHKLYKNGFIDFVQKGNVIDSTITITEKTKQIYLGDKTYLYEPKLDEKSLILPDTIVSKKLFYSQENQNQINMLYSSLTKENLNNIQDGLKSRGFPTGICILLYGAPGTGKTESVYQIAKATNREIIHVDISQTKSCWLGESERLIQKIFDDYKNMCQKLKLNGKNDCPILLFNEADAIIQKRTEFRGGGAEKTENAMQNILLENLEKFDGIMIATTNLEINMDAAFERRFLYKIKFENPTIEAKTAIWQSKLNWLPEEQAKQLANEYNFSGGEIDNVVRKATMEEILNGSKVTMNRLEELCKSEKLINNNSSRKLGFCM